MTELSNCPFCGASENDADRRLFRVIIGGREMVECRGCGTLTTDPSWNRRAAPPIGTRYRDGSGEVVAVVVPIDVSSEMNASFDSVQALRYHPNSGYRCAHTWKAMLDALPEPE